MKLYKIQNKETGLFSTGGMYTSWSPKGKVWRQINHATSHITQKTGFDEDKDFYKDAEIVEYELKEIGRQAI